MANPINTLQATITHTDANGNVPVNRGLGNPAYSVDANVRGEMMVNKLLAAGDTTIELIAATIYQLMVKNSAGVGSGKVVTVKCNYGAGLVTDVALQPGGVFVIWQITNTGGITALTLNASAADTPVDVFMGA